MRRRKEGEGGRVYILWMGWGIGMGWDGGGGDGNDSGDGGDADDNAVHHISIAL